MLYEDMKDGMISKDEYMELHAAYENRRKNAQLAVRQIDLEIEEILERKSKGFVWLDYFTEHRNLEKLTRNVAVSLIREVRVFDKNSIEVIFDFDDCYQECMDNLCRLGHGLSSEKIGRLDIQPEGTERSVENGSLGKTEWALDSICEPVGMERRAV